MAPYGREFADCDPSSYMLSCKDLLVISVSYPGSRLFDLNRCRSIRKSPMNHSSIVGHFLAELSLERKIVLENLALTNLFDFLTDDDRDYSVMRSLIAALHYL